MLEVAGQGVSGLADLFRKIWRVGPAGTEVPLTIARQGETTRVRVRSADHQDFGATLSTSSSVVSPIATFIAPLMRRGFMPSNAGGRVVNHALGRLLEGACIIPARGTRRAPVPAASRSSSAG